MAGKKRGERPVRRRKARIEHTVTANDPRASLGYLVRQCNRAFERALGLGLSRHGILNGQWALLRVLWQQENLSQVDVAELMHVERATLTGLLKAADESGLITRTPDEHDGRKIRIRLTPRGRQLKRVLTPVGDAVNARAIRGLSAEQVTQLKAILEHLTGNLHS